MTIIDIDENKDIPSDLQDHANFIRRNPNLSSLCTLRCIADDNLLTPKHLWPF